MEEERVIISKRKGKKWYKKENRKHPYKNNKTDKNRLCLKSH